MWRVVAVCVLCAALVGCATEPVGCATPELVEYDDDTMSAVAQELEDAPIICVWCELIIDYGRLRAQVRAIRGAENE